MANEQAVLMVTKIRSRSTEIVADEKAVKKETIC